VRSAKWSDAPLGNTSSQTAEKVISNPDLSGFDNEDGAFLQKIFSMRPAILCLVIIIVCCPGLTAQVVPDSIFREWRPDTPGGVACVVHKDQVVFKKAIGLADVAKRMPNSPDRKYDLASNAKQFTAMCIALLEEQGKMSADDALRKYYPDLKITDDIRVRNLMNHSSGLRDVSVLAVLSGKTNLKGELKAKYNTKEYYIQCLMSETTLNHPVGQEMAYNNFNYVLLADIVEKVSGQTFRAFIDSAIFKPLGMTHTFLRDQRKMDFENESVGYLWKGGDRYRRADALGGIVGDHNMVSTVDDLVRWQLNFFNNKLGKKDPALITRVCTPWQLNDGSSSNYAYGLFNTKYKGVTLINHGGDDGRETSMLLRFADHDLSVIVLSNSSRYNVTEKIAFELAEVYLKALLVEPAPVKSDYDNVTYITVDPNEVRSHAGLYTRVNERGLAQMITLEFSNGKLIETWGRQRPGVELNSLTNSHFIGVTKRNRVISIKFDQDNEGFTYVFYGDTLHFRRSEQVGNVLADYEGHFKNASTGATLKIKKKGEKLIARKGIFRIPLMEFSKDKFYAAYNDALFTFVRNDKNQVQSLRVDAPDFRNFWFGKE
jgi:CubicO group peptidase (beta-lactamase class C family)